MDPISVPLTIGDRTLVFKELSIDHYDRLNTELKKIFLVNCELQLSLLPSTDAEKKEARAAFVREAMGISLYSEIGLSIASSIDGGVLLVWAATDSGLTFQEFRQWIAKVKPDQGELKRFAQDSAKLFHEVHKLNPTVPIGGKPDTTNPPSQEQG